MYLAKMTTRGQITIPHEVRVRLGVRPGDRVAFFEEDGEIVIESSSRLELKKDCAPEPTNPDLQVSCPAVPKN
jgi:AbrB family looped-hinge helix DNA binding protein